MPSHPLLVFNSLEIFAYIKVFGEPQGSSKGLVSCLASLPCDGHDGGRDCDIQISEEQEHIYSSLAEELGDSNSGLSSLYCKQHSLGVALANLISKAFG